MVHKNNNVEHAVQHRMRFWTRYNEYTCCRIRWKIVVFKKDTIKSVFTVVSIIIYPLSNSLSFIKDLAKSMLLLSQRSKKKTRFKIKTSYLHRSYRNSRLWTNSKTRKRRLTSIDFSSMNRNLIFDSTSSKRNSNSVVVNRRSAHYSWT